MWFFYILAVPAVLAADLWALRRMPCPKTPWHVKLDVGLAWFSALAALILVPIDVSCAYAGTPPPADLRVWWLAAYWYSLLAQVLTLPLHAEYAASCEFTPRDRLAYSLRSNLSFYAAVAAAAGVGVASLLVTRTLTAGQLGGMAIAVSNAYGLLASLFLMGYGLVDIPRGLWRGADPVAVARQLERKAGRQAEAVAAAYRQACGAAGRAERAGGTIGRRDPLRPYMDKVMDTLKTAGPEVWADGIARGGGGALARMAGGRGPGRGFGTRGDYGDDSSGDEEDYLSRRDLAALHRALRGGVDTYEREAALYLATVQQYIQVQDVLVCMAAGPGRPQQQQAQQGGAAASRAPVEGSSAAAGGGSGAGGGAAADHRGLGGTAAEEEGLEAASHWRSQARWWWRCRLRCWALRGLSGVCWCLCGATVAAELSIRPPSGLPNLSVFAAALRHASAAAGADVSSLLTQLASFLFLGYACVAAYYALYKAGRFSFYLLVPRHTPAYSLCANAMFVARFAPPLAFHYIYALALPPGGQEGSPDLHDTVFYRQIGRHIMHAPLFGRQLTTWLPLLMAPYMLLLVTGAFDGAVRACFGRRGGRSIGFDDDWGDAGWERTGQRLLSAEVDATRCSEPPGSTLRQLTGGAYQRARVAGGGGGASRGRGAAGGGGLGGDLVDLQVSPEWGPSCGPSGSGGGGGGGLFGWFGGRRGAGGGEEDDDGGTSGLGAPLLGAPRSAGGGGPAGVARLWRDQAPKGGAMAIDVEGDDSDGGGGGVRRLLSPVLDWGASRQ